MNIVQLLQSAIAQLEKAGIASPKLDAEVLLAHALHSHRFDLYLDRERQPTDEETNVFEVLLQRREAREPVAYICGVREFWSLPIKVTRDVLIPRPETEHVVEIALDLIEREKIAAPRILDLCTGSGCIAAALASELPNAHIVISDASLEAVAIAQENLSFARNRLTAHAGDLFQPFSQNEYFDVITANPPYMRDTAEEELSPEGRYEPIAAFRAGIDGLDFVRRIIEDAPNFLRPGGWLIMEFGFNQTQGIEAAFAATSAFERPYITKDLAGIDRVVATQRKRNG